MVYDCKKQNVIKRLLTEEFLTVKQISLRLKISRQAVHKTIHKLVKKGLLFFDGQGGVDKGGVTLNQKGGLNGLGLVVLKVEKGKEYKGITPGVYKTIRLHNQHFTIKILNKSESYQKFRSRLTSFKFDGNTVRLNKDNVEVYSNKSFTGNNQDIAHSDSLIYWNNYFLRLEFELKIILVKEGFENVKECRSHYAECDNELARDCLERKEKIALVGNDGKEWLKVDNSYNLKELEMVHPDLSKADMQKWKFFIDDLRANEASNFTALKSIILNVLELNKGTSQSLNLVVESVRVNAEHIGTILSILRPDPPVVKEDLNKKIPDYIS